MLGCKFEPPSSQLFHCFIMAGTAGPSTAEMEGTDSRVGSSESENGNKRIKSSEEDEEEDRISSLPDSLIHQILCLLPAIDLVKTSVLSKWWKSQWTRVPVLEFVPNDGMSSDHFSNFIDKTLILHDCSNIDRFTISLRGFLRDEKFPNLDSWIHYCLRKRVKEIIVDSNRNMYPLPLFVFNNSRLVNLKLSYCSFASTGTVNWQSVKNLRLDECKVENAAIGDVLSGSPLLEHLELSSCDMFEEELVIDSKNLRTLILNGVSCSCNGIVISCPNLERLRISGLVWFTSLELMDLPASVYATLDFFLELEDLDEDDISYDDCADLVYETLKQVEHVEKLEIGRWMMEILSSTKDDGDCIAGFPDSFIHRMLSFLPPKKDAFKSDLYQMCEVKWTDVPILKFVSNEKFVIYSKDIPLMNLDPRLSLWIRLAVKKDVKELILDCDGFRVEFGNEYPIPQFLFNNSSLLKMKICTCDFMPTGKVNWESLKSLQLDHSFLYDQAIENVLSGSPLLERLELRFCVFEGAVVVASEHLKTFLLDDLGKKCSLLEISCPNLKSLKFWGKLGSASLKLMNLPSPLHATLDFYVLESDDMSPDDCMNSLEEIMKQILHVEELRIKLSRFRISVEPESKLS